MPALLFLAFVVVPLAELWVIIEVGQRIGAAWTILLLIAVSIAGTYLLKQQGLATWQRLRIALAEGRMPAAEVVDGFLILLGGAFLLTPGFLTDVCGLLLLVPPSRAAVRRLARRAIGARLAGRAGAAGRVGSAVYEARVVRSRRGATPAPPEETSLGGAGPSGEDGSPGRG